MSSRPSQKRPKFTQRFQSYYVNKIDWNDDWQVNCESTIENVSKWVNKWVDFTGDRICFDCEWSRYKSQYPLGLIQLAVKEHRVLIIDCTQDVNVFKPIKELFSNPKIQKFGFAIANDIKHLRNNMVLPANVIDLQPIIQQQYSIHLKKMFGYKSQYSLLDCLSLFDSKSEKTLRQLKKNEQKNLQWSNPYHVFGFFNKEGQFIKWKNAPIRYAANDTIALWQIILYISL